MLHKIRNRQRGFTLIELLIVVAIIGIIAALLIPNFLDALQKAKQKRTVADERSMVTAFMSLITDLSSAAAAGQTTSAVYDVTKGGMAGTTPGRVEQLLVTRYIQQLPALDGWKNDFEFYMGATITSAQLFAVASGGRDGVIDQGNAFVVTSFTPTDYEQDIVFADGFAVRFPQNLQRRKLR
jgi:type II secretion system protein G